MRKCHWCGDELSRLQKRFCSKRCLCTYNGHGNKRKTAIVKICPICEQEFIVQKSKDKGYKTCSTACKSKRMKQEIREGNNPTSIYPASVSA